MPSEFGDIVLVPFPFTSQAEFKRRPAVIVSNEAYNRTRPDVVVPDVVVMVVTSERWPYLALGGAWIEQWQTAGLIKPSAVKPIFATLEQCLITRPLGTLAAADEAALRNPISEITD